MDAERIRRDVEAAFGELMRAAKPQAGALLVLGCSTSEIVGKQIGSASSEEAATAVLDALLPLCEANGIALAVQGCEHINRALCTDRATAARLGLCEVAVEPWLHAGGACVTEAKRRIEDAVMVEDVRALATLGMDIGDTLIGMHLRPVAVPVHTDCRRVGAANLVLAYARPKYIGGPRARYAGAAPQ
ncbi:MAG: TIGR01440 family protein [Clostridia bacterium]|nr:TIGR01440 family protein [Clostridia bacterium]